MKFAEDQRLSDHCTLGIGGPARYFIEARDVETMRLILLHCKEKGLRYMVLGRGSNCLFDDRGYNGVVILNKIDFLHETSPGTFQVGAGYNFSLLGSKTARQGWSGLEFASGIPGSVGGAVFMNAGANGRETSDSLAAVQFLDNKGQLHNLCRDTLKFSYRSSPFQTIEGGAIVSATFTLEKSDNARDKQIQIITYRKKTQPYGEKSAGCIFRNPEGGHAGALIEQAGLKGISVGGAEISPVHANFIVNRDKGKAEDILKLIEKIQGEVREKCGYTLESEVRFIPYNVER